jgi:Flp pilus assembly protein TadB
MNHDIKQDVMTALKNMSMGIIFGFKSFGKFLLAFVVSIIVMGSIGYTLVHFPLQSLVVISIAIIGVWFYIEMTIAKSTREYEQQFAKNESGL